MNSWMSKRTEFETLLIERADNVLMVTINRPDFRKRHEYGGRPRIAGAVPGIIADPATARIVVLTGSGDRAFCAGADLKERQGMSDEQWNAEHLRVRAHVIRAIVDCPGRRSTARSTGRPSAAGASSRSAATSSDASRSARFALTEVTLGIMPGAGGTQNLPRAVGSRRPRS